MLEDSDKFKELSETLKVTLGELNELIDKNVKLNLDLSESENNLISNLNTTIEYAMAQNEREEDKL